MKFVLEVPPSANRYWRTTRNGRVYKSKQAKQYTETVRWQLRAAGITPTQRDVALRVKVYRKQRRGDLDNFNKVLLDAMQDIVYVDDNQVKELHAYLHDDKHNPRVEVEVYRPAQTRIGLRQQLRRQNTKVRH